MTSRSRAWFDRVVDFYNTHAECQTVEGTTEDTRQAFVACAPCMTAIVFSDTPEPYRPTPTESQEDSL